MYRLSSVAFGQHAQCAHSSGSGLQEIQRKVPAAKELSQRRHSAAGGAEQIRGECRFGVYCGDRAPRKNSGYCQLPQQSCLRCGVCCGDCRVISAVFDPRLVSGSLQQIANGVSDVRLTHERFTHQNSSDVVFTQPQQIFVSANTTLADKQYGFRNLFSDHECVVE